MSLITKAYEALGVGAVISNAVLKKGDVVVTYATSGSSGVDATATLNAGSMTQKYTHAYNTAGGSPDSVCARVYTVDNDVTANITVGGNGQSGQVTVVFRNAQIVDWDSTGYATGSPAQSIPTGYSTPGMGVLLVNRYSPPSNPPDYTWLTNGSASVGYLDNISTQLAQPPALSQTGGTYSSIMALMLAPVNRAPNVPSMNPTGTLAAPALLATLTPTLNWSFSDPDVGNSQRARQLKIYDGTTLIYDSGKVTTGSTTFTYPSSGVTALQPDKVYGWEVTVWDNHDAVSPYATRQYFKTTKAPTVTPKSPLGTSALPLMISQTPRIQWTYSDAEGNAQKRYQVAIYNSADALVHDSGVIVSSNTYYDVPAGALTAGQTYHYHVRVEDSTEMSSGFSVFNYFLINVPPGKPIPDHIPDTLRVGKRPVFEATINDDVENDAQAFVLQLATNSAFTENLLDFRSDFRIEGWEAFDGTVWDAFQLGGIIRPAQLVRDYGFEGVLGGIWKWDVGPLGTGDKINNGHEQKRNGNYSLRIVAASGNNIGVQQELKGWKPGDKVTLDAYVNITNYTAGRLNVDLVAYDANGKNLIDTSGIVAEGITTGFTKISDASITIPANTKTLLVRVFVDGTPNMTAYIDDVTVSIDGVKKYNKVRYTIGVDAYYGEPLTEGKAYYWRMAVKDGLTGTMSEWTDQQTLTNRLGTSGKCENASDWGAYNCTVTTETTNKVDGNASIKVTATNKNVAAAYKDVGGWKAGKYYVILGFIKNGNAENGARIIPSGPTYSASWQIYDKTKFNFYWCKTAPTTDYPGNLDLGFTPTEAGQYAYFDQVRVYEISKAEYELISVDPSWSGELLALRYPYVDNTQTIQRKTRIRCGTTLALQTKPIKTTAPVDRSVFSKFATLPINVPAAKRVEENDPSLVYSGVWSNIGPHSGYSGMDGKGSGATGDYVELTFIGTGIRCFGSKAPYAGIAQIFLDGVFVGEVDYYKAAPETFQQLMYENANLPYGPHKIKIVVTGKRNTESAGTSVYLDFFEILDTKAPAVLTVQASNNANDVTPTWEEVTAAFISGEPYFFENKLKTAPDWGLSVKIIVDAKERLGPIEIDGFGISYE
ncbi:hypothetical protein BP422_13020 [Brevibacillus formosus]|uniref:Fibronectin type-III domain-containing protein n=1 Tax=Brevibacillus formosus TaxID=54913 RepID=A0A220MH99_9BACL|nr:hypothetical protein [Brevibacillus formosus]ASJ54397.1 hypothetical protein BP422_13020 [Brevibacillus formosus]